MKSATKSSVRFALLATFLLSPYVCADDAAQPIPATSTLSNVLNAARVPETEKYYRVSMIQLIANPEKYNSKKIEVSGYFQMIREWQNLYFDEGSYKNGNESNAIGIDLTRGKYANIPTTEIWSFNCRYGTIRGTFVQSTQEKGDSAHIGEISDVAWIQVSKDRGYCLSDK